MGHAVLKHKMGAATYKDFVLSKPVMTVGRSNSNDIPINESSISRLHFRLENRNGRYFILDNNSSNGTFLNRRKVTESPLKDGDMVIAGRVHFVFCQETLDDMSKTRPISLIDKEQLAPAPKTTVSVPMEPDQFEAEKGVPGGEEPVPWTPPPLPSKASTVKDEDTVRDPEAETGNPPPVSGLRKSPKRKTGAETVPRKGMEVAPAQPVKRLLAFLLDGAICTAIFIPGMVLSFVDPTLGVVFWFLGMLACFAHVVVGWLKFGKTLGKHFLGLRIVSELDPKATGLAPMTMVMRFLGYLVCAIPFYLLFLTILFDEEGRGIHDKIAGTRVVSEKG